MKIIKLISILVLILSLLVAITMWSKKKSSSDIEQDSFLKSKFKGLLGWLKTKKDGN